MNPLRMFLILSLILCGASCSKPPEPGPVAQTTPTAPPQKQAPAAESVSSVRTGQATPVPVAKKQPSPSRHLAPEGVFYLTQRVSLTTSSGIVGYPPGTTVTLLSQEASESKVKTPDGAELTVATNLLTNDMDVATRLLKTDNRAQTEAAAAAQRDRVTAEQAHIRELEAESKSNGASPTPH